MSKLIKIIIFLSLIINYSQAKEKIIVFHAGSLSVPFLAMEKAFEQKYQEYDVIRESAGSRATARKITDIKKPADVMASAAYKVIDNLLIPKYAKFNIQFATNEMALAYTPNSNYSNIIDKNNWVDILLKDDVKIGHSNPNLDPCGYRTMLVTKLAEKFYNKKGLFENLFGYGNEYKNGEENRKKVIVRPKETDLLGLLEANVYDYLYIYKSVAQQHNLKYIELPEEINLKNKKHKEFYEKVSFNITGKTPESFITKNGAAMIYGITIIQNEKENLPRNKDGAIKFVNFVISNEGQTIMKKNGQGTITPVIIIGDASILEK
jgi:molybdate/tungstate transport system substrate-binding protein